jgi:hypothetical protein
MKKSIAFFVIVLAAVGCGNTQPKQITEVRSVTPAPHATSEPAAAECPADAMNAMKVPADHAMPPSTFEWILPEGWIEQTPTPIRIANFSTTADPSVECYITVLTGAAGGVGANVNRWRQQMNQAVLPEADIQALPTTAILDTPSPYIEIEGDFTGMSGQPQSGYMMLAAICPLQDNTIFVKMTGPASAVSAEKERFKTFCNSLKRRGDPINGTVEENK